MRRMWFGLPISLVLLLNIIGVSFCAMTRDQMIKSFDTIRNLCTPKFKLSADQLNALRFGNFDNDDKEVKCYLHCTAQMAGVLTKKNELHLEKTLKQIDAMYQSENKQSAIDAAHHCKDIQKTYKDPCDKVFFTAKCSAEQMGKLFVWP
ncbi:general odorant-binding protein lush-like isoform X1 [Bradysia coprophila]|uniref:general odorant-binding protein lush-like isoform X1 n=1 Tax=Bradysia coprophila TaxID=38358 RepID=UPI00187D7BDA|nr:general odorant-binding protein lush-like isoform X1 [Bradysia coprophila]